MKQLKSIDYGIISELVKNSRLSDRQLARILKTSQPTVTRRRKMLDNEGLLGYTAIPDLKKLGFEILAFTFGKWNMQEYKGTFGKNFSSFESFVVSLSSDNVLRNLSFKYVVSLLQEKEDQ